MAVQIINQRILEGITTKVKVSELQQLIAGLAADQDVDVEINRGYDSPRPGEGAAPSVKLIVNNPRPAGPYSRQSRMEAP